jgi:hypothetical protein
MPYGTRVTALQKKLKELTTEVKQNCSTVNKRINDYYTLISAIYEGNKAMTDICQDAEKDSKGRPVLRGDEGLTEAIQLRAQLINKAKSKQSELETAFDTLSKDNTKDVDELISDLKALLKEKQELNKKSVPALTAALQAAEALKQMIKEFREGNNPADLPTLKV